MKRMVCLLLCLLFSLCGCAVPQPAGELTVVATVFPAYDFARQIGGDGISVEMLLPPGGEVHAFEPSFEDLAAISRCDVFIYNGGESDGWVQELLDRLDTQHKTVIRMMDYVELLVTGEEHHHHDHHHSQEEADEHIWTTPENALAIADAIAGGMIRQDEANRRVYEQGLANLSEQLGQLKTAYEELRDAPYPLLVADRFPFFYLAKEYHLDYTAAFSGCTSNTEADLATLQTLTRAGGERSSPVVLHTEFSDRILAETVASATGGTTALLHSCHNVTKEEFDDGVTYVQLMKQNLVILKEATGL